jgi:lipopolysaccharide export system ATP-binding protein
MGTAEELAEDEVVRRVYLGKNFELRRNNKSQSEEALENEKDILENEEDIVEDIYQ